MGRAFQHEVDEAMRQVRLAAGFVQHHRIECQYSAFARNRTSLQPQRTSKRATVASEM
jgi:hypothetical protein